MRPSVCQMVHYVSFGTPGGEYGHACRAAIVTEAAADGDTVGLCVVSPAGVFFSQEVWYHGGDPLKPGQARTDLCGGRDYAGGTWHWPDRDPGSAADGGQAP